MDEPLNNYSIYVSSLGGCGRRTTRASWRSVWLLLPGGTR